MTVQVSCIGGRGSTRNKARHTKESHKLSQCALLIGPLIIVQCQAQWTGRCKQLPATGKKALGTPDIRTASPQTGSLALRAMEELPPFFGIWCLCCCFFAEKITFCFFVCTVHKFKQIKSIIEGSLEVKLPTIWTDEKQSREEAERRERLEERRSEERVRRKKIQMREKVGKSRNTVFFQ